MLMLFLSIGVFICIGLEATSGTREPEVAHASVLGKWSQVKRTGSVVLVRRFNCMPCLAVWGLMLGSDQPPEPIVRGRWAMELAGADGIPSVSLGRGSCYCALNRNSLVLFCWVHQSRLLCLCG